jgi:DNA replication protein DnaC
METVGEILTKQNPTQMNPCDRPAFKADKVYYCMLRKMELLLNERNASLLLNEQNKSVIGQVALWYSNDSRFKGDLHKGLMIRGSVGTGKTIIAKALKETMLEVERLHAKFIYSTDLQDLYMNQKFDEINILKTRKFTIIDDVGVEMVETKTWGNTKEPFNDLFDARYRANLITIITTNLRPSDIESEYGTRIRDRFKECFNDLVLDGESLRK